MVPCDQFVNLRFFHSVIHITPLTSKGFEPSLYLACNNKKAFFHFCRPKAVHTLGFNDNTSHEANISKIMPDFNVYSLLGYS